MAAVKLVLGSRTGALSLFADGLHATLDASSNVVGLVGIAVARRPADAGHPYGHRRFETLAALSIGLLILSGMGVILSGLWQGIMGHRAPPDVSLESAAIVALSIVVNFGISRYEARRAKSSRATCSKRTLGTPRATRSGPRRCWARSSSCISAGGGPTSSPRWWSRCSSAVTAWKVLSANVGILADSARLEPFEVRRVALEIPEVRGAHKIRSRGSPDHVEVDLHIHVDPAMTVERAHEVTHLVASAVRRAFPEVADVMIHTEPADGREKDTSSSEPRSGHKLAR